MISHATNILFNLYNVWIILGNVTNRKNLKPRKAVYGYFTAAERSWYQEAHGINLAANSGEI